MSEYILVIDEGTTSTRAVLFTADGTAVDSCQRPLTQHYPQPGLVEHDAQEIWNLTLACAQAMVAKAGVRTGSRALASPISARPLCSGTSARVSRLRPPLYGKTAGQQIFAPR